MESVMQGKMARTIATVVVYDFETGQVVHMHRHIALEGGYVPDHEEVEKRAIENAMIRQGRDSSRMRILHVSEDSMQAGRMYKVDVHTLALVETGSRPRPGVRVR
jgi:hypothetical protein